MKKTIYLILGFIGLIFSFVGAVIPLLPAFPFVVLTVFSFGKSSEKLHNWFLSTKLYKNNLESYLKGRGMTIKAKIRVILSVTATMTIGFIMLHKYIIGRIILFIVWIGHIIYFIFKVKTINEIDEKDLEIKQE